MPALETPDRIHAAAVCRITLPPPAPATDWVGTFDSNVGFTTFELPDPTDPTVARFGLVSEVGPEEAAPFIQEVPEALAAGGEFTVRMGPPETPTIDPRIDDTPPNQLVAEIGLPDQLNTPEAGDFFRFFLFLFCLPVTE